MPVTFLCKPFEALTKKELYDLMVLRQEVFVVEQNCPYLDADGKDFQSWHLLGYDENENLVAYARLIPKGLVYPDYPAIGRVTTAPLIRNTGIGRKLMEEALNWMQQLFGTTSIKISAQTYLKTFYVSFGFKSTGKPYLEDDIPHIAMVKKD